MCVADREKRASLANLPWFVCGDVVRNHRQLPRLCKDEDPAVPQLRIVRPEQLVALGRGVVELALLRELVQVHAPHFLHRHAGVLAPLSGLERLLLSPLLQQPMDGVVRVALLCDDDVLCRRDVEDLLDLDVVQPVVVRRARLVAVHGQRIARQLLARAIQHAQLRPRALVGQLAVVGDVAEHRQVLAVRCDPAADRVRQGELADHRHVVDGKAHRGLGLVPLPHLHGLHAVRPSDQQRAPVRPAELRLVRRVQARLRPLEVRDTLLEVAVVHLDADAVRPSDELAFPADREDGALVVMQQLRGRTPGAGQARALAGRAAARRRTRTTSLILPNQPLTFRFSCPSPPPMTSSLVSRRT